MEASFNFHVQNYHNQLKEGSIQEAYKGLLNYMQMLKSDFAKKYPEYGISSNFHQGHMDYSFFTLAPNSLKNRKLKIIVLLNHFEMRFEIGLVGQNKGVQAEYWQKLKNKGWAKYPLSLTPQHSVVDIVLVEKPNFDNLGALSEEIENGVVKFVEDIVHI